MDIYFNLLVGVVIMIRNDHKSYIHPAIILTFTVLMGGFLAYIINKSLFDAWIRIALEGDWFWLFASVMTGVMSTAFVMCFDW